MILSIVFAAAAGALIDPSSLPTPDGATSIVASKEGTIRVLTFDLPATFPAAPAIAHYAKVFSNLGWTQCRSLPSEWEAIVWGMSGRMIHEVTRAAWRSPDGRVYSPLIVWVEHPRGTPRPVGSPVTERNRLAFVWIAETVGTDMFVFAHRCEEGPLSGPFSDSDRRP